MRTLERATASSAAWLEMHPANPAHLRKSTHLTSDTASYLNFTACSFSTNTMNGKGFSTFDPVGPVVGEYSPTAVSGGSFSMVR